jgi:two-component system sensor histidine kinase VicK
MLESVLAVPLHFTVEFLGFLVFAGGAVLVTARPDTLGGGGLGRFTTASGFGVLALASVAHGSSFEPFALDGDTLLVAIRTAGFLLLAGGLALPSSKKTAAPAIATFEIREPLGLLPAGAALLLAASAATRARRTGNRTLNAVALAGVALAVSEVLTAVAPRADFPAGTASVFAYAGHAAKLLGYVALATWLGRAARASIRTRFVSAFAALLVVVVLVLSTALTGVISNNVGEEQLRTVESQLDTVTQTIEADRQELFEETGQVAGLPEVRQRVAGRRGAGALVRGIREQLEFFEIDFLAVLDSRGRQLAYSREGPSELKGGGRVESHTLSNVEVLSLLGSPVVDDLVSGRGGGSSSIDVISDSGTVMELAGIEVNSPSGGEIAGYLVTARWIDQLTIEKISASFAPTEATLVIGDRVVASTLPVGITADAVVPEAIQRELVLGGEETLEQNISGNGYFGAVAPLPDGLGNPTAATLSMSAPSAIVADTREDVIRVLFLTALGVTIIVLLLAWLSGRQITRPIRQLTRTAAAVREGDLDVTAPVSGEDEVGRLGQTFNEMTSSIRRMTGDLRTAAHDEHDLRERIEKIIQSMADALIAIDAERNIVAFNAEAEVMTGRDAAEVIGLPINQVLTIVDAQDEPVRLPIYDLGEGSLGGVFLRRRLREPVPVTVTSAALRDETGEIAGGVAVLRDMTREREVERLKSEFLSNISHELRTPLTPIKGYADIMSRQEVPLDKQQRFASGILTSTVKLERIIGLLVDFASLEAGRLAPKAMRVDVAGLLGKLHDEWAERATHHTIEIEVEPHLAKVFGDERLLRRSIEELLDNAIKFSPNGGVVELKARNDPSNGQVVANRIEITVADQGIGIEPDDAARVFGDFQQVDGSETRSYGGLGLGLAFVRRIVEAHDGTIEVDNSQAGGTRFILRIPSVPSNELGQGGL